MNIPRFQLKNLKGFPHCKWTFGSSGIGVLVDGCMYSMVSNSHPEIFDLCLVNGGRRVMLRLVIGECRVQDKMYPSKGRELVLCESGGGNG